MKSTANPALTKLEGSRTREWRSYFIQDLVIPLSDETATVLASRAQRVKTVAQWTLRVTRSADSLLAVAISRMRRAVRRDRLAVMPRRDPFIYDPRD